MSVTNNRYAAYSLAAFADISPFMFVLHGWKGTAATFAIFIFIQACIAFGVLEFASIAQCLKGVALSAAISIATFGFAETFEDMINKN